MELSLAGEDGHDTGMAILRTAFPAELVRRLHWSWRHAQRRKKTDALSALARQMDSPIALVPTYAELARGRRADGTADEPGPAEDERDAHHAMTAATAMKVEQATRLRERVREALFKVSNHHSASCGEPPAVDGDAAGTYVGYFANEYGEQAVYTYDHGTGEATIRMGDAGWHDTYRVEDGQAEGLLLGKTEAMWLRACWLATGALKDRPTPGAGGGTGQG